MADPTTEELWASVETERTTGVQTNPPATPDPVQVTETPVDTTPETPNEVDPYANLHPDIRAKLERFDQLAASLSTLPTQLKEATGRVAKLQSEWDKSRQQAAADAPNRTQIAAAAKDPEKWGALKKDFPEWGDAISEFVESRLGGVAPKGVSSEELEQLVAQRTESVTTELTRKFNEDLVTVAHRNWKADIKTEDFAAWSRVQAPEIQALAGSKDPFDAIRMLDLYAEHKKRPVEQVQANRQAKLAAAVTTKPNSGVVATKSVDDMTPAELWDHEAKQREKRAA